MIVPVAEAKVAAWVAAAGAAGAAAEEGAAIPKSMAPERATVVTEARTRVRIILGVPFSAAMAHEPPAARPPLKTSGGTY